MGRKGMKGFMKSAARPSSKAEEEEAAAQDAAAAVAAGEQPPSAAAAAAVGATAAAQPAAAVGDEAAAAGSETRGQTLQRHKRELLAHKKTVQRMGKKSKDELAKLDAELDARHAQELAALDAAPPAPAAAAPVAAATAKQGAAAADGSAAAADRASKYLKDLSVAAADDEEGDDDDDAAGGGGKSKKLTKAQKRREKAAAKDAEREARIAAELAELGPSERVTEEAALSELLLPLALGIKEIRADGHCLYRSLEDQLQQTAAGDDSSSSAQQQPDYQQLRELAAEHIRQHREQFAPFLLPEDEGEDPEAYFESYCETLASTAAWGGHLELTALSAALQRHIRVHAVGMDAINLGEEEHGDKPPLEICYLQHAFGLGQHYNSTKRSLLGGGGDYDDDDEVEEEGDEDGGDEAQES